jgi:hypothetical protein
MMVCDFRLSVDVMSKLVTNPRSADENVLCHALLFAAWGLKAGASDCGSRFFIGGMFR